MAKADGLKIGIKFTQPLVGTVSGNEDAFTVTFPEYDFVPNGTLGNATRDVASAGIFNTVDIYPAPSSATLTGTEAHGSNITLAAEEDSNG